MQIQKSTLLLLCATLVASCINESSHHTKKTSSNKETQSGVIARGVSLSKTPPMTVDDTIKSANKLKDQTVKVQGEISQVCQKSGCWLTLRGSQSRRIRLTSKDYKHFVPKNVVGMIATAEGVLSVEELDEETKAHYAADAKEAGQAAPQQNDKFEVGLEYVAFGNQIGTNY